MVRIGTAGWTIPKAIAASFVAEGKHLERYARSMNAVEVNSSFYRPHRRDTWRRWAGETPDGFRFAAKLPRTITHRAKLVDIDAMLDTFLAEVVGLGDKLAVLLVQLPPSFAFDADVVDRFFASFRTRYDGAIVCEPRHRTWFEADADASLVAHRIARAAADPALSDVAARPGGWTDALVYHRWHGSPRTYWSAYDDEWIAARANEVASWADRDAWCIFDNTGAGAALDDASKLKTALTSITTSGDSARPRRAPSRRRRRGSCADR